MQTGTRWSVLAVVLGIFLGVLSAGGTARAQSFRVLYNFMGGTDGMNPSSTLLRDSAGNLYGTTDLGGAFGAGTVFKVDPSGVETVLYSFAGGTDGYFPQAGLLRDAAGNLYGTTLEGGGTSCSAGCGTVFKVDVTGTETVLYRFVGGTDGNYPFAGLLMDVAGNLYGTTTEGGGTPCPYGCGIVFKVDALGTETVLYRFVGGTDGEYPYGTLVADAAGNLYGTTLYGGTYANGTVFELQATGTEVVLHSLGWSQGVEPESGVIRNSSGNLYGATTHGALGSGAIFEMAMNGKLKVLHSFQHSFGRGTDGASPTAALIRDVAGNLYGTTVFGGLYGDGTVFKVSAGGAENVLHNFTGPTDGASPWGGLIRDSTGNFYGTARFGGSYDAGVVFEISPK